MHRSYQDHSPVQILTGIGMQTSSHGSVQFGALGQFGVGEHTRAQVERALGRVRVDIPARGDTGQHLGECLALDDRAQDFAVDPVHQARSIGKLVMPHGCERGAANKCRRSWLATSGPTLPAVGVCWISARSTMAWFTANSRISRLSTQAMQAQLGLDANVIDKIPQGRRNGTRTRAIEARVYGSIFACAPFGPRAHSAGPSPEALDSPATTADGCRGKTP